MRTVNTNAARFADRLQNTAQDRAGATRCDQRYPHDVCRFVETHLTCRIAGGAAQPTQVDILFTTLYLNLDSEDTALQVQSIRVSNGAPGSDNAVRLDPSYDTFDGDIHTIDTIDAVLDRVAAYIAAALQ